MRLPALAAVACAAAAAVAGCTGDVGRTDAAGSGRTPGASSGSAGPTSTLGVPTEPLPPPRTTPPPTAGPLSERQVAPPTALGSGWATHAEEGGAEEGFVGNGTWTRRREPAEVLDAVVPIGCPGLPDEPPRLERPEHALEATYRQGERPAVSVVLEYADAAAARRFMTGLGNLLRTCRPVRDSGADATGAVLDLRLVRADADTVVDLRREVGGQALPGTWQEVVVRAGRRVALLSLDVEGARTPAPDALAAELRRALAR